MKKLLLPAFIVGLLYSCNSKAPSTSVSTTPPPPPAPVAAAPAKDYKSDADTFLKSYSETYQKLYTESSEAEWISNTHIVPGDETNAKRTQAANEVLAKFTGSEENIKTTREFLNHRDQLAPIQVLQLEAILYKAANNPQTAADIVSQRIKAETQQTEKLYGYDYKIGGKSVTTNQIDAILKDEKNLTKRLTAWNSSKEVGKELKEGLVNLRELRNKTVQALGYEDYFSYQASEYGMNREEMMELIKQINEELLPLYRELHTYARYELAKKYGAKQVPDQLPAHWLPNRWGQDWSSMVTVKGLDIDNVLKKKGAQWQAEQAERFYVSLGFPALPKSFWEKSSLYPLPANSKIKKNNHASAWHMDLDKDVRSLMSIEPNSEWYETTHHEYGHVYYYMTYSNPDVPVLLRSGANRAYHEALGSLMGLAANQKPFMAGLGLVDAKAKTDDMQALLKEALNYVVFIPFASGVMTEFEHDLYAKNLSPDEFNKRWWELAKKYQGIVPPSTRSEDYFDAGTKTHINDDPAQYYDYALSYVILFQLHDHISQKILQQDPHATNYYGNKDVGEFLQKIMYPGASANWREMLREKTGEDLSARAMVDYFKPLMEYLKNQNKGRKYTI
jgi:peptidyl-dipeptidase A